MDAILLGIIGCGHATQQHHLPALRSLEAVRVVALADTDRACLEKAADRFGISGRYTEAQPLLDDPAVEAVAICTPTQFHADLALRALAAGKHVFVEKPLALTVAEGKRMVEAAAASGKVTAIGFNLRCHRLVRRAREMIAAGAVGEVRQAATVWSSSVGLDPETPAWRQAAVTGGGALFEIGVHHLDACAFLLNDRIENVRMASQPEGGKDDSVSLLATTRRGILISSAFSQVSAPLNEIRILGDRGALSFSLYRADSFSFTDALNPRHGLRARIEQLLRVREWPELLRSARGGGDYALSYPEEWTRFAAAVRGGSPPASSFDDGLAALQVIHAAMAGRESGAREWNPPLAIPNSSQP